jgi:hypothetical protein
MDGRFKIALACTRLSTKDAGFKAWPYWAVGTLPTLFLTGSN